MELTLLQKKAIQDHKAWGIEFSFLNSGNILVEQVRLHNGFILNHAQLLERGKQLFPDRKIKTEVFEPDYNLITVDSINNRMSEFGITFKDIIKHLGFDKTQLSKIMNGNTELSKRVKAAFYFYFLTFELNRDFRDYLEITKED